MGNKTWKLTQVLGQTLSCGGRVKGLAPGSCSHVPTRMLTDPTQYNLAIWFMEYSMLSSSIHFHCTMFIVDWLNLALPLERIQVRGPTLCYRCWQRSRQNHGSVWQAEYVTGEITCCASSTLALQWAAMNNSHDFKAVLVLSCSSEIISCFCVLESDFTWLLWS